ncbi:kinase-like protein, partial [Fistulina hepatica ATCC 64428]
PVQTTSKVPPQVRSGLPFPVHSPVWLPPLIAPLTQYIVDPASDDALTSAFTDPHTRFVELVEIAEGESGSVFQARDTASTRGSSSEPALVAIKHIVLFPPQQSDDPYSSALQTKLFDLERELQLLRSLPQEHNNVLYLDAVYVEMTTGTREAAPQATTGDVTAEYRLWVRMELMERSLADVIELVDAGLILQDRTIARLASDTALGLEFLQEHFIAHRDIRSDNLLLSRSGIVKITDFSTATRVSRTNRIATDVVGTIYWQAPEMRSGPYDALKVDVWSLGATVWEMAQAEPPFANLCTDGADIGAIIGTNRWPKLRRPDLFSPAFHEFLRLCSEPSDTRPYAATLTKTAFLKNACGRPVIQQLLVQCTMLERQL